MTKTFYIFRHGATFANLSGTGYGDQVLSASIAQGSQDVLTRIGEYFKNIETNINISSTLVRCRESVAIIGPIAGKKFVFDKRVNEFSTVKNEVLDESLEDFKRRLKDLLSEIDKKGYKSILICTHGAVVAGLTCLLTRGDFNLEDVSAFPDTGVLVTVQGKKVSEINFN